MKSVVITKIQPQDVKSVSWMLMANEMIPLMRFVALTIAAAIAICIYGEWVDFRWGDDPVADVVWAALGVTWGCKLGSQVYVVMGRYIWLANRLCEWDDEDRIYIYWRKRRKPFTLLTEMNPMATIHGKKFLIPNINHYEQLKKMESK